MKWVFKNKLCLGKWARGYLLVLSISSVYSGYSTDHYWKGGGPSGNVWSEPMNWTDISGNILNSVPNFNDDVYLNTGSGIASSVYIDCHAVCRDFDGSGIIVNGNSNFTLRVFRDFDHGGVIMAFSGDIHLEAINTTANITSAGQVLTCDVYFNGPGGVWNITDGLFVDGAIFLVTGTLNVNSTTLEAERFYSNYSFARTLDYTNSDIEITGVYSYPYESWQVSSPGSGLNIISDINSGLSFTGSASPNGHATFSSDNQTYEGLVGFTSSIGRVTMYGDNTFDDILDLQTDVYMVNSNTVEDLIMTSGHIYTIQHAETLSITSTWTFTGPSCNAWTTIRGSHPGNTVLAAVDYLPGASPLPSIDYLIIEDVESITNISTSLATSVNLDALANWPNNPPAGGTLVWDGSGDGISWGDPANWSGSVCAPSPLDDVVFNSGSFSPTQTNCTIDVSNAVCRDMTWNGVTNNPTFTGSGAKNLTIYGSLTLEPAANMTWSHSGYTRFKAHTGTQTVDIQDQVFTGDTYFEGNGGAWDLAFDFQSQADVYVHSGTFNTQGFDMSIDAFLADIYNPRAISLNASNIICATGWDIYYYPDLLGAADGSITFNAGTSTIDINSGHFQSNGDDGNTYNNLNLNLTNGTQYLFGDNTFTGNVTFLGSGIIPNSNSIDGDITFSGGKAYYLSANQTLTQSTADLIAIGDCTAGYIYIQGGGFTKTSTANPQVEYCIIKNNVAAGVSFTGDNSVLQGSSNGIWSVTPPYSGPLYFKSSASTNKFWNTGNNWYSNAAHTTYPANGPCPPNPLNDVYFITDAFDPYTGSGNKGVEVNVSNAFCKSMYWSDPLTPSTDPNFKGWAESNHPNNIMRIHGELYFLDINKMDWDFNGQVIFQTDGTSSYDIVTADQVFTQEVTFDGNASAQYDLNTYGLTTNTGAVGITMAQCTLNTNSLPINAGHIYSTGGSVTRRLNIAGSALNLETAGQIYNWYTSGNGLTVAASGSTLNFDNVSSGGLVKLYAEGVTFNDVNYATNTKGELNGNGSCSFNDVTFLGNGTMYVNNTFNGNLTFSPGYVYTLYAGTKQTIGTSGNLVASGTPNATVFIKSSAYGPTYESQIEKIGGIICLDYASIRDNDAVFNISNPAQYFDGPNGFNVDNNTGWAFTGCTPATVNGCVGDPVSFSTQFSGSAYNWGFGDGGTATTAAPSHTYTVSGVYTVTVTVTSGSTQNVEYFTANITQSCCQEASDPNYTNISGTISTDAVWPAKVYVSANVTITSGAVLEIANSDVVFANGTGILVESTSHLEAVNSTFRPCNPLETWTGIELDENATGAFNENVFIGAENGLAVGTDGIVKASNNQFTNCEKGMFLTVETDDPMPHVITGNTFIHNEDNQFANPSNIESFYGIQVSSLGITGVISQNDFSYTSSATVDDLIYGIHNNSGEIVASENNFTNVTYAYYQNGTTGTNSFENNEIDFNASIVGLYHDGTNLVEIAGITISGSPSATYIGSNTITMPYQTGQVSKGIYSEGTGTVCHLNRVSGMEYGIHYDQCDGEISRNEVMDAERGIYLSDNTGQVDVIDNTVTASTVTGILLAQCPQDVAVRRNTIKNDPLSSGTAGTEYILNGGGPVSNVDFRDNCVFDTEYAMYFEDQAASCYNIPDISGNYLFNYTNAGIYSDGFQGNIGGTPSRNSFVDNELNPGTVWDILEFSGACAPLVINGYWPATLNVTGNVTVGPTNPNDNSFASCGNQTVKEGDLPAFQAYIYDRYPIDYENRQYLLKQDFADAVANVAQSRRGSYAMSTYGILASNNDMQQASTLIAGLEAAHLLAEDELRWIKYQHEVKSGNTVQATQHLNNITPADLNEEELLFTEKVRMRLAGNGIDLRSLGAQDSSALSAIDERRGEYAAMARDMIHVARGRHPFIYNHKLPVRNPKTADSPGNRPAENALLVYPNPTQDDFIVSFNVENLDNARLTVATILGVQMMNITVPGGNARQLQLDATDLPAGVYMVSFYNNDQLMDAVQLVKN